MSQSYRALVEAAADRMIEEGTERVPLDSLCRATSCGYVASTFEMDVANTVASRNPEPDPDQLELNL